MYGLRALVESWLILEKTNDEPEPGSGMNNVGGWKMDGLTAFILLSSLLFTR